jgi:hypothetical protein
MYQYYWRVENNPIRRINQAAFISPPTYLGLHKRDAVVIVEMRMVSAGEVQCMGEGGFN